MSRKLVNLDELRAVAELRCGPTGMSGAVVGRLVGVAQDGHPLVEFAGCGEPIVARHVVPMTGDELAALADSKREVLLAFEGEDARSPIITGILQFPPRTVAAKVEVAPPQTVAGDTRVLRFEAQDEIVLTCGEASITLRRNGRVVIRGTHLESDSLGANWIRGLDIQLG